MAIPQPARNALAHRLGVRRRERWPSLVDLSIRYRGSFAYVSGSTVDDDEPMPLFRLRYVGSSKVWGFAVYLASKEGYEESFLPSGGFTGTPEEALDCTCGLYLNDISAWTETAETPGPDSRTNF